MDYARQILPGDIESKKKLQHIYELSSKMSADQQYTDDNIQPILPVLDSDEDSVNTIHNFDDINKIQPTADESMDPPTIARTALVVQHKVKRPLQLMAKWADFIMDSGCTAHVIGSPAALYNLRTSRSDRQMGRIQGCIAGASVKINGFGTLFPLGNVLVAPFIANNLISVPQLTKDGFTIVITENRCTATKRTETGDVILTGYRRDGLYICAVRCRSDHEANNSREMTVEEHDDYQYGVRCNMMTIAPHHLRIEPKEFTLADDIVIDSGSPEHMFRNKEEIDNYFTYGRNILQLEMANGQIAECYGYGSRGFLKRVYHVPSISHNLLSVQALAREGCWITFTDNIVYIDKGTSTLNFPPIMIYKSRGLYILPMRRLLLASTVTSAEFSDLCAFMMRSPVSRDRRVLTDEISPTYELIVDSGCSQHMFNSCRNLTNYVKYDVGEHSVTVANGTRVPVHGYGTCGVLYKVYFVPDLSHSLLSVNSLTRQGMTVEFTDDRVTIRQGLSKIQFDDICAVNHDNMYRVSLIEFERCTKIPHVSCLAHSTFEDEDSSVCHLISDNARTDPISTIHYRFGHPSAVKTRHICKCYNLPGIRKLEMKAFDFLKNCEFCRRAKAANSSFKGTVARPEIIGKQWYADVKGPFSKPSLKFGNHYVFGIVEAKTRLLIQFYIKNKSDVGECIRSWYETYIKALRVSAVPGKLTHIFLHTDMGESTSHKIIDYLNTVGISLKTTCPHTPEQNMVIERVWRTIGESAIAMLLTAELSESYWEEARKTACYVYNRSPGAHEDASPVSPYQQYYGIAPHVSHLQIFGTKCYAKDPTKDKGNHEQKAWPGIFVGYQDQQPIGWRIYLPESDEFIITAHATFEDHRVSAPSTENRDRSC